MKKIKKIKRIKDIIIIMVIMTFLIINGQYKTKAFLYTDADIGNIGANIVINNSNVYCVQKGQVLKDGGMTYYRRLIVKITGNKVYFIQQRGNSNNGAITGIEYEGYGNECEANNIFAAILYMGGGYGPSIGNFSDTQLGVFQYWDTWKSASGASSHGAGGSGYSSDIGESIVERAKELSESYEYSVEFHVLEHVLHKYQQLIAVYSPNRTPKPPPKIDITVTKKWTDDNNSYKNRPSSIKVTLYRNGSSTGKTLTLNQNNGWKVTFSNLEPGTGYSVKETGVPVAYNSSTSGNQTSGYTITNTLKRKSFTVQKTWDDLENTYGYRPTSVKLRLMRQRADGGGSAEYVQDITLKSSANWKGTVSNLPAYVNGYEVNYFVEEIVPDHYIDKVTNNLSNNSSKVVNSLDKLSIKVTKKWSDNDNKFNNRPDYVRVYLYINGVKQTNKYIDLKGPNWEGTFTGLDPVSGYTVNEEVPNGYTSSVSGNVKNGFTITNTLERTSVAVEKVWEDENNLLKLRPSTIKISLYQNVKGVETEYTNESGEHVYLTLKGSSTNSKYKLKGEFTNLPKYIDGVLVSYSVREEESQNANLFENYMLKEDPIPFDESKNSYVITNVLSYDGYTEITGRVWVDGETGKGNNIDGKFNANKDYVLKGIKVTLRDANGNQFDNSSVAYTDANGQYTIKVNYDSTRNVYKLHEDVDIVEEKLKKAYVEFEYDGLLFTTISNKGTESIVTENSNERTTLDRNYSKVTADSPELKKVKNSDGKVIGITPEDTNRMITAVTEKISSSAFKKATTIKERESEEVTFYCNGAKKTTRTNTKGAWLEPVQGTTCNNCQKKVHTRTTKIDVQTIQNVNCALFVREQPVVGIISDISSVKVAMNGYNYTYLYGVRSNAENNVVLQTKFQNKNTYEYRRPVNPADIAYVKTVNDGNNDLMQVEVTYKIKLANLSTTLPVTIHNIVSYFDPDYEVVTSGLNTTNEENANYGKTTFTNNIDIRLEPQTEQKDAIYITYKVSQDQIKRLLSETPTLNNAVEIESYSTEYGSDTVYAEQGKGGRTGKPYAGYDFDSHPGNAEKRMFINGENRLEIKNQERDEDIAPSFVLCLDEPKSISGTVWDDLDVTNDSQRLGNGYIDDNENKVKNVKVELYNVDGTIATLYDEFGNKKNSSESIQYTNENGIYSLEGLVTGQEYYIKFEYGDDTTKLGNDATTVDGKTIINARNYKSTIIKDAIVKDILSKNYADFSETDKEWPLLHQDGYSIAVDNMEDRLKIPSLYYDNFNKTYTEPQNMTAYTKPFRIQLEFYTDTQKEVEKDGEKIKNSGEELTDVLDKFDFGISERAREDLFVQKTITNFEVKLSNGQVLTGGDPTDPDANIAYTKTMGLRQKNTNGELARNAQNKRVLIEMDTELIQGSTLELTYEVTLTNNNELDYDYGELSKYDFSDTSKKPYDLYITQNENASYYYYGNSAGLNEMQSVIQVADYINKRLTHEANPSNWTTEIDGNIINDTKENNLKSRHQVYQGLKNSSREIKLERGDTVKLGMTAKKKISNQDDNAYDNSIEILEIDGKTGRTIQEVEKDTGKQITKTYYPGNFMPDQNVNEQDDDTIDIIITPPTGLVDYITIYAVPVLIGLAVVLVVIIIMKKVSNKK